MDSMEGLVIKSTGSSYVVEMQNGECVECHIKGNLRLRGLRTTNPVAVGDRVTVSGEGLAVSGAGLRVMGNETLWITDIKERRNYIIRRSTNLSKESHILAANLDQVLLLVTIDHPVTSPVFVDRFLATAEAYRVPTVLVYNKIDLLTEEQREQINYWRQVYEPMDYTVLTLSAKHPDSESLNALKRQLNGQVTLLAGNSGVGKSTLLNTLFGKPLTRTGVISDAHDKGMHTTTFSEMYDLREADETLSGKIIDIPGIKGFGSIDMEKTEIGHYFRDIFAVSRECRYSDCLHMGEPGCAVIDAVNEERIAPSRYESYISLLGDCTESKYR